MLAGFSLPDDIRCINRNLRLHWLGFWRSWIAIVTCLLVAALVFEVELVAVRAIDRDALLLSARPESILNAFARA